MNNEAAHSKRMFYNLIGIVAFMALLIIDQLTKSHAVKTLKVKDSFVLIDGVFELHYLENFGAAFGIMQGQRTFFVIITIIILIAVFYIYGKMPLERKFNALRVILVLIGAGALGNFIDRTRQGYVVDFFYFSLIDFPIFNVADIYVTSAAIALVVFILFYYKEKDLNLLFKSLKPGKSTVTKENTANTESKTEEKEITETVNTVSDKENDRKKK